MISPTSYSTLSTPPTSILNPPTGTLAYVPSSLGPFELPELPRPEDVPPPALLPLPPGCPPYMPPGLFELPPPPEMEMPAWPWEWDNQILPPYPDPGSYPEDLPPGLPPFLTPPTNTPLPFNL